MERDRMNRWANASMAVAACLAVVAVACGGGTKSPSSPAQSASSSAATGGQTVLQGQGGKRVFTPSTLSVHQGDRLTISNVDSAATHTFTIQGKGINVVNPPGQSGTAMINLSPGTYTFICTFHVGSGMKGTITVTG